jgi:hypothetical protein
MKLNQIEGKEAYSTKCNGHQFILTWNNEGFWMIDYISERGDRIGVDDAFTLNAGAYLIKGYVHDVLDSRELNA